MHMLVGVESEVYWKKKTKTLIMMIQGSDLAWDERVGKRNWVLWNELSNA